MLTKRAVCATLRRCIIATKTTVDDLTECRRAWTMGTGPTDILRVVFSHHSSRQYGQRVVASVEAQFQFARRLQLHDAGIGAVAV